MQQLAELIDGSHPEDADGSGRPAHSAGHVGERQPFQVAQDEHFTVVSGQSSQLIGQASRAFAAPGVAGWSDRWRYAWPRDSSWVAAALVRLGAGEFGSLVVVLAIVAVCALVLDAFEMIFVVIPMALPPLLTIVHNATWVAVLTLLILQASFLTPPSW